MAILIFKNKEEQADWRNVKNFSVTDIQAPSISDVYNLGQEIEDKELQAFYYMLYLSAGRVSEVLQIQHSDIQDRNYHGHKVKEIHLVNEKNKKKNLKTVIIPVDNEYEQKMWAYIQPYYEHSYENQPLFPNLNIKSISRNQIYNLLSKYTFKNLKVINPVNRHYYQVDLKLYPHFMRHCRLTDLVKIYQMNPEQLKSVAGWSSVSVSASYVSLNGNDVIDSFYNNNSTNKEQNKEENKEAQD